MAPTCRARKRLKEKARKGRRAAEAAGEPEVAPILCLGRVLDAHDEQDDAEGGRRDWEEDPLGFDTNPGLLRAMCMAFE